MKRTSTFIIIVLIAICSCKDDKVGPGINEPNYFTYYGSIGKNDNSTIVSSDNNLIICGNANEDGQWSLIKITKLGKELWRKDFAGDEWLSNSCALTEAENGDLFVCGDTHRNWDNSKIDILLVKTNKDGDTLWTNSYGGPENDYAQNIIKTSDGKLLMSGWSGTDSLASGDINLLKLDYSGDLLWENTYTNPEHLSALHLLETKNGEYLITGSCREGGNLSELYLLKVDANGLALWDRKIGPASGKTGRSTIELSNGDLVICGDHRGGLGESIQVLLLKTDHMGTLIWEQEYGVEYTHVIGNVIKQNLDESYTITGRTSAATLNLSDIILLKVDQSGNQLWFKTFGLQSFDKGANLIKDSNDDNLITGDFGWGGPIFLTRTDKDGNFK